MNHKKGPAPGRREEDDVEELLRAAEDEMLLNLARDSHMSRVSPSYLHPDLDRRFRALKSPSSSSSSRKAAPKPPDPPQRPPETTVEKSDEMRRPQEEDDDLLARFVALKASLPSSSPSTAESHPRSGGSGGPDRFDRPRSDSDDADEDEVAKVIQWAIDAARLDPSPPSDDDDDHSRDRDSDSDDESDSEDEQVRREKVKKNV
ncbi:uncharacterized protein LOC131168506 [Malania oleifera]|uniref:uncharacterized protein LOC131168506 n=1 Tax=Malania oleifera TaxID=397392 RepID=UPI0025ADB35C|nr:uncharacterized protein LOC131168506 [Malania oleifera]